MFELYQPSFLPPMPMPMTTVMIVPVMTGGPVMVAAPMVVVAPTIVSTPAAAAMPVPVAVPLLPVPAPLPSIQQVAQQVAPVSPVLLFNGATVNAEFVKIVPPGTFRNVEISVQIPEGVNFDEARVDASASKMIIPTIFNNIEIFVKFMPMPRG
jgi:hypothetical protein